ncbi:predicted protein [Botrytis cinerea T4]|uniref:Uncharacterized protein n=1 Tax=Botryotinia fuckeliana (strain T4) TaxID=999810 RepID=G2YJ46_BOTF4|nr:predicted protein [Botrytis cinerea T4]
MFPELDIRRKCKSPCTQEVCTVQRTCKDYCRCPQIEGQRFDGRGGLKGC